MLAVALKPGELDQEGSGGALRLVEPSPGGFLYDMAHAATLEAGAWLLLARDLANGARPWAEIRARVDLLVAERRSALHAAAYRVPR